VLGVRVAAVGLELVVTELRRRLLPRGHARPHGDGAHDGLEVEEPDPTAERLQLAGERRLHHQPVLGHGLELPLLGEVELLGPRQVVIVLMRDRRA
jgi:hypothetical protein